MFDMIFLTYPLLFQIERHASSCDCELDHIYCIFCNKKINIYTYHSTIWVMYMLFFIRMPIT